MPQTLDLIVERIARYFEDRIGELRRTNPTRTKELLEWIEQADVCVYRNENREGVLKAKLLARSQHIHRHDISWRFEVADITNVQGIAARLESKEPIVIKLFANSSLNFQTKLLAYLSEEATAESFSRVVVEHLNRIIEERDLSNELDLSLVQLHPDTHELLSRADNADPDVRRRLNRMIIRDVFQREVATKSLFFLLLIDPLVGSPPPLAEQFEIRHLKLGCMRIHIQIPEEASQFAKDIAEWSQKTGQGYALLLTDQDAAWTDASRTGIDECFPVLSSAQHNTPRQNLAH